MARPITKSRINIIPMFIIITLKEKNVLIQLINSEKKSEKKCR